MIRMLRRSLLFALFAATLICSKSARAQITSIYLSHMAGGPIASWTEEAREISFDVVTPSHSEVLTLDYRVYAGTAEAGVDFVASSGTFTFQPNEQIKQ